MNNKKFQPVIIIMIFLLFFEACSTQKSNMFVSPTAKSTATVQSPLTSSPVIATSALTPSPTTEPTPQPTLAPTSAPTDPIGQKISKMSDQELIGQMVMIGFTGTQDMDSGSIQLMQDYSIGNVILFGWNTETFEQTKGLTANINSHNKSNIPLNIAIDIEGGSVTRFKGQWKPFISSAQRLGQINDPKRVHDQYERIGKQLKEIGFTMNLAPVLDIAKDSATSILGNRMFGSDPKKVSALVKQAVKGLQDGGIASIGKHFPGHGETSLDSHDTLPVIDSTLSEMKKYSLVPFQAAIDQGIDAMLVAHLSYPNVDNKYTTSVSPTVITKILREDMGFKGVVFSDDLRMQGLRSKYSVGEGAVLHILAGGDVVLIGKYYDLQTQVLQSLYKAVQEGRITRERLEQSVRRILEMKLKYINFKLS